jgi:hypothetical protein
MTGEERRSWIMIVVAVAGYATYVLTLLGSSDGSRVVDVAYKNALLWTVGGAIAGGIVANIGAGLVFGVGPKDQRDREINRFGEYIGTAKLFAYRKGFHPW